MQSRALGACPQGIICEMFGWKQSGGPWGGGPWGGGGSGGGGGGPWGGGPRGNGQGPRGRGPQPPNIEELLRRSQDQFRRIVPGGFGSGKGFALLGGALVLLWLISGLFRVQPDEVGVVLRFGAYNRTVQSGLNWHLPTPIETVLKPKVTRINRVEVGFRAGEGGTAARAPANRQVPQVAEEALMLTGDENIVDINFSVFWLINDATKYLFNIRQQEQTVKAVAESAMREVIGRTQIASAFAEGRGQIEAGTRKLLQDVLDSYGAGISITQVQLQKVDPPNQVIDAFRDVQRARADQERARNEAEAYRNDIIPRARGEAVRLVQEAEAYKQEVVAHSQGDAERFLSVYNAYKAAPDVTTKRLYLETMEEVLKGTNKVIIDKAAEGSGVVPYLPLPELARRPGQAPRAPQQQSPPTPPQQQQQQQQPQRGTTR
jgi:membrane protease subunit HflK